MYVVSKNSDLLYTRMSRIEKPQLHVKLGVLGSEFLGGPHQRISDHRTMGGGDSNNKCGFLAFWGVTAPAHPQPKLRGLGWDWEVCHFLGGNIRWDGAGWVGTRLRANTWFWGSAEPNMFGKFYRTFGRTEPNRTFSQKMSQPLVTCNFRKISQPLVTCNLHLTCILHKKSLKLWCVIARLRDEFAGFFGIYTEFLEKGSAKVR